jgi:hypothetical protein
MSLYSYVHSLTTRKYKCNAKVSRALSSEQEARFDQVQNDVTEECGRE